MALFSSGFALGVVFTLALSAATLGVFILCASRDETRYED